MDRVRYTGPIERFQGETAHATAAREPGQVAALFDRDALKAEGWRYLPAEHFQRVPATEGVTS